MINDRYFNPKDLKCEIWRDIPGFTKYKVSNCGRIKNIEINHIMTPQYERRKTIDDVYLFSLTNKGTIYRLHLKDIMIRVGFEPDTQPEIEREFELDYNKSDEFIYNCF